MVFQKSKLPIGSITVSNGKTVGFLGQDKIYIGRKNKTYKVNESILHNPFVIGKDGNREECLVKFRKYLWEKYKEKGDVYKELIRIVNILVLEKKDIDLVCWCFPEECHGNVIKKCLEWIIKEEVNKIFYIAIVGSRHFEDYEFLKNHCNKIISDLETDDLIKIVSGGAKGVDTLAKQYATEYGYECIEILPDWDKHKKSAGMIRNKEIVDKCNYCIAFWDYKSPGTQNTILRCKEAYKPITVITID